MKRIDAKRAVAIAMKYFIELFPDMARASVLLEELEGSDDEDYWFVTIGFDSQRPVHAAPGKAVEAFFAARPRKYKTFKVSTSSGKVTSMKIRTIG